MGIPNNNSNTQFSPGQLLAFQMNHMNNANTQQKGQFFGQNVATSPQFLNQNVGFGGMPNPMQNINIAMNGHLGRPNGSGTVQQSMNGNLSKQMANANQQNQQSQGQSPLMNSFGIVQQPQTQNFNAHTSANSQVSQGVGPQSSNFGMNAHLGLVNGNLAVQQSQSGLSKQMPNATQQLQGQLPLMNPFGFVQQPQTQNFNAPANTQATPGRVVGLNQSKGNQPNSYNSNFSRNQKHGDKKSKFDKGKFSNHNKSHEKGHHRNEEEFFFLANSVKPEMEKKRSLLVTYSAQEIRRWREERRKNYPSKANIEKLTEKTVESEDSSCAAKLRRRQLKEILAKQAELGCKVAEIPPSYLSDSEFRSLLVTYSAQEIRRWREERRKNYPSKANIEKLTEKTVESEDSSCAAKLRRQQLKEILAKQAELGCKVAYIPPSYLSDSEKQVDGREQKMPPSRKERYQKRFNNKREKFNRNDRFSKKRRFGNSDASNTCEIKRVFPQEKWT